MATHPYISGPGNVEQMVVFLRKNFPSTVTSETVKKFAIASNNESYIINALQFIGVIDEGGRRTPKGQEVFVLGNDDFPKAFGQLIRESYKDLFDVRGEDAWILNKSDLTSYFRTSDKTSEVIGGRQAGVFQVFARLSGYEVDVAKGSSNAAQKAKVKKVKASGSKPEKQAESSIAELPASRVAEKQSRRDMAMTVRIEINLPANGSQETYDNIFKSIRENLIDD
ncbi:DUF5343 domain-containing protein [Xanthobacter autotrophicus]|uniref:DUF5343 domain-containing protein n=1 Tax=Xanthobacter autotrophicus TaxID=280 RepID=UPI0024A61DAD|nr:DUF5343 domain-containing protein [Xanthobacter autotrophicus]MDI4658152.1 DUF5343 domain-containing protein [Xanthobacter autotrophicus]